MALVATACFAKILLQMQHREPYLAALAFAFVPMVYIASVSAMDYIWALAFVLLAVLESALSAGVALWGCAGTCGGYPNHLRAVSGAFGYPSIRAQPLGCFPQQNRDARGYSRDNQHACLLSCISPLWLGVFELCGVARSAADCSRAGDCGLVRHGRHCGDCRFACVACFGRAASAEICRRGACAATADACAPPTKPLGSSCTHHSRLPSATRRGGVSSAAGADGINRAVCGADASAVSLAMRLTNHLSVCVRHSLAADGDLSPTNGCCCSAPRAQDRFTPVTLGGPAARTAAAGLPETPTDGHYYAVCSRGCAQASS
jgi:hypothetical protein